MKIILLCILAGLTLFSLSSCNSLNDDSSIEKIEDNTKNEINDVIKNDSDELDGPGAPMRYYKGTTIEANEYALSWNFNNIFTVEPNESISNLMYMAEMDKKVFYEKFDLLIDDNIIDAKLSSINIDFHENSKIEYHVIKNVLNEVTITIYVDSVACTTIQFANVSLLTDTEKIVDFVKNKVVRLSIW